MLHGLFHKTSLCTYISMLIAHLKSKGKSISIFYNRVLKLFLYRFGNIFTTFTQFLMILNARNSLSVVLVNSRDSSQAYMYKAVSKMWFPRSSVYFLLSY